MRLIIVVGLSASGKSMRVNEITHSLGLPISRLTDITLHDEGHRQRVKDWLNQNLIAVIDTACCNPEHGGSLEDFLADIRLSFPEIEVETRYFENNPLQCIKNALADAERQTGSSGALARIKQICRDTDSYRPPMGTELIPVFVTAPR